MYQPPPEGPSPNSGRENPFLTQGPQGNYPSYPPQGSQFPGGNYPSYPSQGPQYTPDPMQGAYNSPTQQYLAQPASPPPGMPPRAAKKGFSLGFLGIAVVLLFGILIGFVSGFGIGHSGQNAAKTTAVNVPTSTAGNQVAATPTTQPTDAAVPIVRPTATAISTVQPIPTQTSTSTQWTTTHSFSGNKISKTTTFTVPNDWNIQWSCVPGSAPPFYTYNFVVFVYNSDGTLAKANGINVLCKNGNASGNAEQNGGGTIYLEVVCAYTWNVNVQEKK
jgi:hypothetical protein